MNQNEWFLEDPLSMETSDRSFSDFIDVVRSWMPQRSEPANVSRDFWMPDDSCRVCYDCDSQFTIFNRRHHCRHCGRVFCAKCTSNFVPRSSVDPTTSREEGERVRVCNYCFKQLEEDVVVAQNGARSSTVVLSPSLSTASLASTKSSCTGNSTTTTAGSVSYSTGTCQHVQYGSIPSPSASPESCPDKQDIPIMDKTMESIVVGGEPSNHFGFCLNRSSDDDDDDYGGCHSYSQAQHCQNSDDYYRSVEFDNEVVYQSNKLHAVEGSNDDKDTCSFVHDKTNLSTLSADKMEEHNFDNGDECDTSSSIYGMEGADAEPVDFENNGLLWLPPEPEDEEDDRELVLFDDDDDDASGEWGYLRSSNSFGRGEYRNRDRSAEEHKKAMKNIVDGHFRALVSQLLQAENLSISEENGKESWLDIITSLSWEAASLLKPDTSKGGGMDPGGYVKVKCLACGRPNDSMVVKGVVCKKNVAHRRMSAKIEKPRFLILEGALEYQRVSNLLSSFDTLLQQEMDYLKMAVAKIQAHQPTVLLVEKTVSRHAQELFLDKNISLVLNIKRPLLERIARCTGAQIVPSIDHLSSQKLGCCDFFHVEKFLEDHGSAGQDGKKMLKTLMFFEGCPKPFGCTILLKGANGDELKKVKHVMQYGVFAAYHLALETSFLADEGATLPELPLKTPLTVALPNKPSNFDRSISLIPGFIVPSGRVPPSNSVQDPNMPDTNKASNELRKIEPMVSPCSAQNSNSQILNVDSTFVAPLESCPPNRNNENEFCAHSKIPFPSLSSSDVHPGKSGVGVAKDDQAAVKDCEITSNYAESLVSLERGCLLDHNSEMDDNKVMEKRPGSFNLETLHHGNNIRDEFAFLKEDFLQSPSDHQSILVSLSSRCVWKGTVCERAHLFRIKYYGSFDKPLGRFLRDHLFDQSYRCLSCEMPSEAHIHCYTHHQGSLTISVRKLPELILPGERDGKIWMWHRCLRCPRINGFPPATRRVVMSDAAWGLSFGKFLELSFSNHAAASRVASCGHSLHRDCLRFYGFGRMVACFRYAAINVHSVYLPPAKLDFSHQHQEWVEKEAKEVADTARLLFTEVKNALQQISERRLNTGSVVGNVKILDIRRNIVELEGMLQVEKAEFMESLQKIMRRETKKGQPPIDILEVNKLRRQLLFLSYLWDQRLVFAAGSHNSSLEVLSSFPARNKEKLESTGNLNLSIKSEKSSTNSETLSKSRVDELPNPSLISPGGEVYDHPNQSNVIHLSNNSGKDGSDEATYKIYHATNSNVNDQLNLLESSLGVHRVLSEGQFPSVADISDTLDAKWRGENSNSLVDISMPKPLASVEAASAVSLSGDSEDRSQVDLIPFFASALPARWGDTVEELSSWIKMPFLIFYHSFNKNSSSALRFDIQGDYNPVYVSVFRELARQGGARLFLPAGVNGTIIPVFDDEPTSIISYALVSPYYHFKTSDDGERPKSSADFSLPLPVYESGNFHPLQIFDDVSSETFRGYGSTDDSVSSMSGSRSSFVSDPLTSTKEMHVRVLFADDGPLGKMKYTVTCYYAKCFEALRKTCCPSELDFIRSLSRCKKWGAQGGKSNVFFAKSLDDRFIIKQVTKTELESFIKFAPEYFKYLSESISTGSPTCLAKILGIYQVTIKHLKGGKESRMDLLVMENLLFGRNVTRLYDLKGSSRSRYNPDSSGNNKVLLDQNLIEAMPTSPIFVGNKAKRLLERAVWNDTSFLASVDVMDYSLLVGVDEEKHELILGIIDFMRQYTWDKHLETWVKASGFLGGPKNASPTVISPKQYKKRFRKAMSAYFLVVPDQWSPPTIIPSKSQSDLCQDNLQSASQES
ncbi:1-phosphatidylinositol-3-phosphate 5-kinase FAB1B-like [Typha latifolia]|uniref:1-phosphatidylinositol-3-phosphate 5-kinase FAB1B-like n=1 Tax=Typha latifolia TaxID=4733 RepID=UPI003C2C4B3E